MHTPARAARLRPGGTWRSLRARRQSANDVISRGDFLALRRAPSLDVAEGGLDDISISRAGQAWGIRLPFDPQSVVYVWFDALINYISAVGFGRDEALFTRWWPASLHVIGKDITRFHCVIWPAMLMSAGVPLPERVFGHGFGPAVRSLVLASKWR